MEHIDGLTRSAYAQKLLTFNPKCPYAKPILIENDWEQAKPHIAEWEQNANKFPAILAALARRYSELARYDEAQRALVRYIGFSPDHWAYDQLAKNYKESRRSRALAIDSRGVSRQDGRPRPDPRLG